MHASIAAANDASSGARSSTTARIAAMRPRGDAIYNNHIARFGFAVAVSGGSVNNMFTDNTLASFTGAFREPQNFVVQGGTNVEIDNTSVIIPTTDIVRP